MARVVFCTDVDSVVFAAVSIRACEVTASFVKLWLARRSASDRLPAGGGGGGGAGGGGAGGGAWGGAGVVFTPPPAPHPATSAALATARNNGKNFIPPPARKMPHSERHTSGRWVVKR